jgi:hypothetical protein
MCARWSYHHPNGFAVHSRLLSQGHLLIVQHDEGRRQPALRIDDGCHRRALASATLLSRCRTPSCSASAGPGRRPSPGSAHRHICWYQGPEPFPCTVPVPRRRPLPIIGLHPHHTGAGRRVERPGRRTGSDGSSAAATAVAAASGDGASPSPPSTVDRPRTERAPLRPAQASVTLTAALTPATPTHLRPPPSARSGVASTPPVMTGASCVNIATAKRPMGQRSRSPPPDDRRDQRDDVQDRARPAPMHPAAMVT